MLGTWLLFWGGLALGSRGETAFLRRADDSTGRCTYSFTVASPVEAGCPDAGGVPELRAELAALAARLSRLESRERGMGGSGPRGGEAGGARDPQHAAPAARLEAAYSDLLRAKSRLEEEKGRLEREKEELGRRLESSAQEIARLRATRCPPGGEGPGRDALRAPGKGKCRGQGPSCAPLPPAPHHCVSPEHWSSPFAVPAMWYTHRCPPALGHPAGHLRAVGLSPTRGSQPIAPNPLPIPKSGLAAGALLIPSSALQQRGDTGDQANLQGLGVSPKEH